MAYVGGETSDTEGIEYTPSGHPVEAPQEFPYTEDAMFTKPQGNTDALFMQITPRGSTLHYSTFFGGTDNDRTYGLAVDPAGNPVLAGLTFSSAGDKAPRARAFSLDSIRIRPCESNS